MKVKDFTQLEYFRTVAQVENITKAAAELHVSQPNLSVSIKRIETALGVALFERKSGRLFLNDFGKEYLKAVEQAIHIMEDVESKLQPLQVSNGESKLSIGSTMRGFLEDLTGAYLRKYADSNIRISQNVIPMENLIDGLFHDRLDVALIPSGDLPVYIDWEKVLDCPVAVLLSSRHVLASKAALTMESIAHQRFVCNNTAINVSATKELCKQAGFVPDIVFDATDSDVIGKMVDSENCLALISVYDLMWLEQESRASVTARPIAGHPISIQLGLARKRQYQYDPLVTNFYRFALTFFSDLDAQITQFWMNYQSRL